MAQRPKYRAQSAGLKHGWRSGLEEAVTKQLRERGVEYGYEAFSVPFSQPEKARHYTPDFSLPNGIVAETKGRLVTQDRQKHVLVKEQHPDLDVRFVFSNPNQRISKQSKTTYAMWATAKGFKYAARLIPEAWFTEPVNQASLEAIKRLQEAA